MILLLNSFSIDENLLLLTVSVISLDIELKDKIIFIHFLDPISSFSMGTESSFLTPSRFSLSSPLLPVLSIYANEY